MPFSTAFCARPVVAADVDDQRVVELAQILDRLDDPPDLVVGVGEVGGVDLGLPDEQLLLLETQAVPGRQVSGQGVSFAFAGMMPEPLLVGEDRLAQLVPAVVEEVHRLDLVDPFLRRVVRRMGAAGDVVDEERLLGRDLLQLAHVADRVVGHGGGRGSSRDCRWNG